MRKVPIPETSVQVARLGFGCARIFGGREMRASARLIEAALKQGVTHFDTAPSYGSEGVLGEVLAGMQDVTIATKVGIPAEASGQSAAKRFIGTLYRATLRPVLSRMPSMKAKLLRRQSRNANYPCNEKRRLRREEVLRELDMSLRNLRRAAIDIYLVHEPDAIELTDELLELFQGLQRSGTIKAFGLAFGGAPTPTPFGQVVQCCYDVSASAAPDSGTLKIYHGVVRLGMGIRPVNRRNAPELVRDALVAHPAAAVIFSASAARQVSQMGQACFEPISDELLPSVQPR